MKAFQLKITIKNSKPPIWRRVIVPTGITFSQLSMILNKVMGWSGYHLFEFEFYYQDLHIVEDADEFDIGYGPWDYMEASTTYIREYLEENDWFTYVYDLGDDWQHRVTIEKIIEDYEYEYPQVIKYKGDSPIEDCGGIYGYYNCLQIISDKTHPEYEERLEWMESQGYPCEYDIDEVNSDLKKEYSYQWGKGETRSQGTIYEEHFLGKYGLNATKKDKNKNVRINKSVEHQFFDIGQMWKEAYEEKKSYKERVYETSLKDIFLDYTKEDLIDIAKEKGMTGISGCNKNKLIDKLVDFMLQPERMKSYFLCIHDIELEEFENATKTNGIYEPNNYGTMLNLHGAAYIGMLEDGGIVVPKEVAQIYDSFKNKEFEEERKKKSFLLCCLRASINLYGIVPFDVFMKLVNRESSFHMTEDEVREKISNLPLEYIDHVLVGNKIYHTEFYPNDGGLLRAQGNKEFYIPTKIEIIALGLEGFLPNDDLIKFQKYLMHSFDVTEDEAIMAGRMAQMRISSDCRMQDIFDVLEDFGIYPKNDRELNDLAKIVMELWNNTRMILNRGFTANELRVEKKLLQSTKSKVIDFGEAKKNKIYPNDPCPCGSGKKYKSCCKNK